MSWLIFALSSYFLSSLVILADKFLLSQKWKEPIVYATLVGLLNCSAFLLWPFDFSFLGFDTTLAALAAGFFFFLAIFFLYRAITINDVSRVAAIVGGFSAFWVLILSYIFLGERLSIFWWVSFFMLITGTFLLALKSGEEFFTFGKKLLFYSILSSVFFAFSFFFTKVVFLKSSFINGFVWSRVGTLLPALASLLVFRRKIFVKEEKERKQQAFLNWKFGFFLLSKGSGAAAFLLLNYAIKLGSVIIVNALRGIEYMFVFLLSYLISSFSPVFLKEEFSKRDIIQKFTGAFLIALGVALLFLK